ncbi:MAG: hypothetical protein JXR95_12270 [Deltaproteobacteria bacterium]|nr:hypothetical protein [Deltaproteobacteria bacterium]
MPSLMPGMPGTKEAYGISILRDDYSIVLPPAVIRNYALTDGAKVVFVTTHRGEGGLAVLNRERAEASVFKKIISEISDDKTIHYHNSKVYALSNVYGNTVRLNPELAKAFHLEVGVHLMSVKSTTIAVSLTPIEIWKTKFQQRGLEKAVENMSSLQVFK